MRNVMKTSDTQTGATLAAIVVACAGLLQGCAKRDTTARFTPSTADAEAALNTALSAWKSGVLPGLVPETSPVVHVTDSYRSDSESLVDFEILGEVPGVAARCFAVDLQFDPPREEKVRYVVVGIDPLWVFRLEDYELLAHWEHKMDDDEPRAKAGTQGEPGGTRAVDPTPAARNGSSGP
jgi:hypothetical protein